MDASAWGTWAAAGVATFAAAVAVWQARSARASVHEARKAREAAEAQASSSAEAVEVSRQMALRADRPQFEITSLLGQPFEGRILLRCKLIEGAAELSVGGTWESTSTMSGDDEGKLRRTEEADGEFEAHRVVIGSQAFLPVNVADWADFATVRLDLWCVDVDDERRTWRYPSEFWWIRKD